MLKIFEFLKFYYHKVVRRWWAIFVFVPILLPQILLPLDTFYFNSKYAPLIQNVNNSLNPWWKWVVIFIFLLVNIEIIYKLWNKKEGKTSVAQYDNIPEAYMSIARKMDNLLPATSIELGELFGKGYKCLTEPASQDIKTAICIHLDAYKKIYDCLIQLFASGAKEITIEMSQFRVKFESNYMQLKDHNNTIGQNNNLQIDTYDVQKLINNINDNLNALFIYL